MGSSIYNDDNSYVYAVPAGTVMTTTTTTTAQNNPVLTRGRVVINVSAVSGTSPSCVVGIQAFNPVSNTWVTVTSRAAITAAGDYVYLTGPGSGSSAGVTDTEPMPIQWRLIFTITGTTPSFTFGGVVVELFD